MYNILNSTLQAQEENFNESLKVLQGYTRFYNQCPFYGADTQTWPENDTVSQEFPRLSSCWVISAWVDASMSSMFVQPSVSPFHCVMHPLVVTVTVISASMKDSTENTINKYWTFILKKQTYVTESKCTLVRFFSAKCSTIFNYDNINTMYLIKERVVTPRHQTKPRLAWS